MDGKYNTTHHQNTPFPRTTIYEITLTILSILASAAGLAWLVLGAWGHTNRQDGR